jgi:hypothetical protein
MRSMTWYQSPQPSETAVSAGACGDTPWVPLFEKSTVVVSTGERR